MTSGHPGSETQPEPSAALRLIFEYEGSDIRLVSRQRVEMTPPPTDPLDNYEGQGGFWVEVRDASSALLHRRVMHNPVRHDVEVFSDDPDQSMTRMPVEQPRGTFAVLVPEIPAADHVALVSGHGPGLSLAPAAEVARFPLGPGSGQEGGS